MLTEYSSFLFPILNCLGICETFTFISCSSNIFLWNIAHTFIFRVLTRYQLDLLYPYSTFLQNFHRFMRNKFHLQNTCCSPLCCIMLLLATTSIPILIYTKPPNTGVRFTANLPTWPQKPLLDWYIIGLFKRTENQEQFLIFIPLELLHEQHPALLLCYQLILSFFYFVKSLTFQTEPGDYQRDMSGPVKASPCNSPALKTSTVVLAKLMICSLRGAKAWEKREDKVKG